VFCYECDTGELRLANGTTPNQGRVEFCRNGVWGTVSDYWFDINDAKVVCRKLGYNPDGSGLTFSGGAPYGEGVGQVFLGYLNCQGTEDQILDCDYDNSWIDSDHSHDVGITCPYAACTSGALRLTGGYVSTEGTLEVCIGGAWNSICADSFQIQDGYVACRQLGFPATATQVITSYRFNNGHGSPTWTNFDCFGNESTLAACNHEVSVCQAYNTITATFAIVGLKCEGDVVGSCTEGSIRLSGPSSSQGIIEICSNNAWGTVSADDFGNKDGLVACRQLGRASPSVRVYSPSYFGDGSGGIFLSSMQCLGSENNLYSCNRNTYNSYDGSHSNDATIQCWNKVGVTCTDWDVRLAGGSSVYGRVEICQFQEWGSVCDDSWDRNDARVICKMRGFNPSYASFYLKSAFGDGNQIPINFDNIGCNPSSNVLNTDCNVDTQIESNCIYGRTAGVRCFLSDSCTDGAFRLQGGSTANEGELQVCRDGVWGYICDNNWKQQNARVVCRQLGKSTSLYSFSTGGFFGGSQDEAPLVYDRLDCTGSEQFYSACSLSDFGTVDPTCTGVGGIMCEDAVTCSDWSIQLAGTSTDYEGRLEICRSNVWTTVSDSQWDYNDAQVACRNLGYHAPWSVAVNNSQWGSGNKRVNYYNFSCDGSEGNLQSCISDSYTLSTPLNVWYDSKRAGVSCRRVSEAETCSSTGAVRLKDGINSRGGRFEVCMGGYWGSVCNSQWTAENTLVACRQVGYETLRPLTTTNAYAGQGEGPVNMAFVRCTGTEDSITDCPYQSGMGVTNCFHGNDVGIICPESPVDYYEVNITASLETGDIPINSDVTMTCNSYPAPPSGVTYQWRSSISEDPLVQSDITSPQATVTVSQRHPTVSHYYCAMMLGDEVLGIGTIKLTLRNLLVPTQYIFTGSIGNSVTLSVTQTSTDKVKYLRKLQWYFDGIPIQDSIISSYTTSSDNLSLTINNFNMLYSGEYYLQYDGLYLYQYSSQCEQTTLEVLREYPLFAPAVMWLQVGSDSTFQSQPPLVDSILTPSTYFTAYKKGTQYLTLTANAIVNPTTQFVSLNWREYTLSSFTSSSAPKLYQSSGILSPSINPHFNLNFVRPTVLQSGYYEISLSLDASTMLNTVGCGAVHGYNYADFFNTQLGFTNPLVLGSAKQEILYYESPSVRVVSDVMNFTVTSSATLTCTSYGGYPLYYNVTLIKNGASIANNIGSPQLVYNTDDNQIDSKYGTYQCMVNNSIDTDSTTIFLQQKASFDIPFEVDCNDPDVTWDNRNRDLFLPPIMKLLQEACNCSLSSSAVTIDNLVCIQDPSELIVTLSLIYSSDDGSLISTDVFQKLNTTFTMGNNLTLTLSNNQTLSVKWSVVSPPIVLPDEGLLAIMFIAGFLVSSIVFIIILVITCIVLTKRKEKVARVPAVGFHVGNGSQAQARAEDDRVNITNPKAAEGDDDDDWDKALEENEYIP
jgi:deleted-in-malignant-brain-tumors protein 1